MIINIVMELENAFTVHVNSRHRMGINQTDSDFDTTISIPKGKEIDTVVVLQAVLPKTYWLIQVDYNTFILREDDKETEIEIPAGNYSRTSFQYVVTNLLNANSKKTWTYAITYPNKRVEANTGLFTYTVSGNSAQPQLDFTNSFVYEQFGFEKNSVKTFENNSLTSTVVVNFNLEDVLVLRSNIARNQTDNILQHFFVSQNEDFSDIVYTCPSISGFSKPIADVRRDLFNFFLTDEEGTPISLNGANWNMCLLLYKRKSEQKTNDIMAKLEDALKLYASQFLADNPKPDIKLEPTPEIKPEPEPETKNNLVV